MSKKAKSNTATNLANVAPNQENCVNALTPTPITNKARPPRKARATQNYNEITLEAAAATAQPSSSKRGKRTVTQSQKSMESSPPKKIAKSKSSSNRLNSEQVESTNQAASSNEIAQVLAGASKNKPKKKAKKKTERITQNQDINQNEPTPLVQVPPLLLPPPPPPRLRRPPKLSDLPILPCSPVPKTPRPLETQQENKTICLSDTNASVVEEKTIKVGIETDSIVLVEQNDTSIQNIYSTKNRILGIEIPLVNLEPKASKKTPSASFQSFSTPYSRLVRGAKLNEFTDVSIIEKESESGFLANDATKESQSQSFNF